MGRAWTLAVFVTVPLLGAGQSVAVLQDSITEAIDEQVWRPFVRAFNAQDAEAYLALHAKNVVRWPLGWGEPQPGDSMRAETREHWNKPERTDEQRVIELWFTHRSHTSAFGYDIGYYRVTVRGKVTGTREFVGHFTTILGQEEGRWRIFLDADNGDGVKMEDVLKGVPLKVDRPDERR